MAQNEYTGAPKTMPSGDVQTTRQQPAPLQFAAPVRVDTSMFGGTLGRGLVNAGQGATRAAEFFGEVAADNAANQYQESVDKILRGDPSKTVPGPDGKPMPDPGYFGTKGETAMNGRAGVLEKMEDVRKEIMGNLTSLGSIRRFDDFSRRQKTIATDKVGQHADVQTTAWYTSVNKSTADLSMQGIANNAEDPQAIAAHLDDLVGAYVKQAQVQGGGPIQIKDAEMRARRDGLATQIQAIGATNPRKAMDLLDLPKNREIAGTLYDNLHNQLRARADQQIGRETADSILAVGTPPPAGNDTIAVVKHFEGYRPKAYLDHSPGTVPQWRVGYGSDTITGPDGKPRTVREGDIVTPEDAERDLQRRVGLSQAALIQRIGGENWAPLSDQAKASLTSVAYNYGDHGIPNSVVEAAKTGDPDKIAAAIRGLSHHNEGVNANRRASEANNVAPAKGPDGKPLVTTESEAIQQVLKDPSLADKPQALSSAISRIHQSYEATQNTKVRDLTVFKSRVADSTSEALHTGTTSNPIPEKEFIQHFGTADGPVEYQKYTADVEFGAKSKALEGMSNAQQDQTIAAMAPTKPAPGESAEGYAYKAAKVERLQKRADQIQKLRAEDPAGSIEHMPAVQQAKSTYDDKRPGTFWPVMTARLEAQREIGIPEPLRSVITEGEAKSYATALKPVTKEGAVPPQEQDRVINGVVDAVKAKYGDHATEAMSRILYHVTMKKDVAEVLSTALLKGSRQEDPAPSPEDLKKIQIERDAQRAAQIAGQAKVTSEQGGVVVEPGDAMMMGAPTNPATVRGAVNQSGQTPQKTFPEAVEMLRSDPGRYMPYFVQKFGIAKVPEDLRSYLPKPEPPSGR